MKTIKIALFASLIAFTISCSGDSDNGIQPHTFNITVTGYVEGDDQAEVVTTYDGDGGDQLFSDVPAPSNFFLTDTDDASDNIVVYVRPGLDTELSNVHVEIEDVDNGETVFSQNLTKRLVFGAPDITATEAAAVSINYDLSSNQTTVTYVENISGN